MNRGAWNLLINFEETFKDVVGWVETIFEEAEYSEDVRTVDLAKYREGYFIAERKLQAYLKELGEEIIKQAKR